MSYIGKAPGVGVRNRYYFTATGGETSLSGTDDASNTLAFSDGKYVDVTLNGVTLVAGTDYDTATANTIDNLTALTAGDVVEVVVYDVFSIAAAVPPTGGTFTGLVQFNDQIIIPRGTTAQRPASPVAGSIRFNSTEQRYEGYDGSNWQFLSDGPPPLDVEYIVIAGGGGGGTYNNAGGGGAGGYRSSISGESSGGGSAAETALSLSVGTAYSLIVGAGGSSATSGANSIFASITANGGGTEMTAGGSGGGSRHYPPGAQGAGTAGQGYAGGGGYNGPSSYGAGGGGGASSIGGSGNSSKAGDGGAGVASSVSGVSVTRAGGGGGGSNTGLGSGGAGGGGNGAYSGVAATAGAANTGSGGGGGASGVVTGGAGGSGVIILKVPAGYSASFSAGVSQTSSTVGTDTVYTITAAGASDTVTFS